MIRPARVRLERTHQPTEALRAVERGWIAFRDAFCALTGSDAFARARCVRDETARQNAPLMSLGG